MRRVDVAEWFLSLATTREKAAPIAGDLAESASTRGALWFWSSLAGAALSLAWRAFAVAPVWVFGAAVFGSLLQFLFMFIAALLFLPVHLGIAALLGFNITETLNPDHPLLILDVTAAFAVSAYLFGKWLARWCPQRELSVYLTSWLMIQIVWVVLLLTAPSVVMLHGLRTEIVLDVLATIMGTAFTFVGIERKRRLLPTSPFTGHK